MLSYALPPYPVSPKMVAQYGRGRLYFPAPVEFRVPLLCCVASVRLFYFVTKVSVNWEHWELAVPQSLDNHVLCYTDPQEKGNAIKAPYVVWTVAQLRRKLPHFWHQSVVLTSDGTWLPMEMADPFNLLGFTCFPVVSQVSLSNLPEWATVGQKSSVLAISIVKPVYVSTPLAIANLESYAPSCLTITDAVSAPVNPCVSTELVDIFTALKQPVGVSTWPVPPSTESIRDYLHGCSQKAQRGLFVQAIVDVYHQDDHLVVYLCQFAEFPAQSFWVAESLLELLELHHGPAYDAYRGALRHFQIYLQKHVDSFEAELG